MYDGYINPLKWITEKYDHNLYIYTNEVFIAVIIKTNGAYKYIDLELQEFQNQFPNHFSSRIFCQKAFRMMKHSPGYYQVKYIWSYLYLGISCI